MFGPPQWQESFASLEPAARRARAQAIPAELASKVEEVLRRKLARTERYELEKAFRVVLGDSPESPSADWNPF